MKWLVTSGMETCTQPPIALGPIYIMDADRTILQVNPEIPVNEALEIGRLAGSAPELLEALEELVHAAETLAADGGRSLDLRQMYAAIAKATGKL